MYNNYALIVSEAPGHGLQIFDLTQLESISSFQTLDATHHISAFGDAHNIFVNEDSGFAYVVGSNKCRGGMIFIDLTNSTNITDITDMTSCYEENGEFFSMFGVDT